MSHYSMSLVARSTQLNYISSKWKTAITIIETMTTTRTMIAITVALEQKTFFCLSTTSTLLKGLWLTLAACPDANASWQTPAYWPSGREVTASVWRSVEVTAEMRNHYWLRVNNGLLAMLLCWFNSIWDGKWNKLMRLSCFSPPLVRSVWKRVNNGVHQFSFVRSCPLFHPIAPQPHALTYSLFKMLLIAQAKQCLSAPNE